MSGWETQYRGATSTVDVLPVDDMLDHDQTNECPCGPRVERVLGGKGPWVCVHRSFDGRETVE